ncbi:IS110 family transposase [Aliiruegeria sabulilitoris]|uniref:IS110 family transposase n=1 Tax=Aliiruegeria sabulilitoris TaxID=1510458 RepID=UPI0008320683|nr:IS110 family transposase [Aliiruegeria sabulilitoris]NDR55333.1 IS110 family transposase [Pseudoruegeria sp. M32A2M]
MEIAVLGIDLGKTTCSVAGLDRDGAVVLRKRVQRHRLQAFLSRLPPCIVAMEACGGAHHLGHFCVEQGHDPRLMSPLHVRPYVKVHKTDDRDAEAIAEAATRPTMSFVTLKRPEQLDLQAQHRAWERLVQNRTRLVNQARGFLMERGIRIGTGRHVFQRELRRLLEDDVSSLMPGMIRILSGMAAELAEVNDRVAGLDAEIRTHARQDQDMRRLMEIPGVGPTIATALVAAIGDGSSFHRARDLSAWLGLVPRQITTGGKARLIGISKHGNSYLRKLFIHGARTVLHLVRDRSTPLARWVDALKARAHANVAGVAMANKLARISWAVLTRGERYRPSALVAT